MRNKQGQLLMVHFDRQAVLDRQKLIVISEWEGIILLRFIMSLIVNGYSLIGGYHSFTF